MNDFFKYAAHFPPIISWSELYDIIRWKLVSNSDELQRLPEDITQKLDERIIEGEYIGTIESLRVIVSGCPVSDASKIFRVIEEAGGAVVAIEACSGMKGYTIKIEEDTGDPLSALAKLIYKYHAFCMTPNRGVSMHWMN